MKKILNKSFKKIHFLILFTLIFSGCDKGLESININPNESVTNPSLDLLFGAIAPGFIGQTIGSYSVTGQFCQQFAIKNSDAGILSQDDDSRARRTWETAYSENSGALRNASFLIYEAKNQENQVYQAVGKIYKVYMLSYITDLFGDIPYADAGQAFLFEDNSLLPKYDPQEMVYKQMNDDLIAANELLSTAEANQLIDEDRDLLFQGDRLSWRKFANTLRLRLLMRSSNKQDVSSQIATIFSSPSEYPVLSSIDDEPMFSFASSTDWTFYDSGSDNNYDRRISATAVDIMKGEGGDNKVSDVQDPRLSFLIDPTENSVIAGTPEFVGQPVGVASDNAPDAERSLLSTNFKSLNKFWLITYAELLLIKAEAAHRGFITDDSKALTLEAVEASIGRYGIDTNTTEAQSFLSSVGDNFDGNELKTIAIQRWLNQINDGFEGYSVWRRMNFPTLTLGPDISVTQIPTRYFYSVKTTDKNQANADIAIARAPLNGQNTIYSKVWWDD